jgi:hypothetical protein
MLDPRVYILEESSANDPSDDGSRSGREGKIEESAQALICSLVENAEIKIVRAHAIGLKKIEAGVSASADIPA